MEAAFQWGCQGCFMYFSHPKEGWGLTRIAFPNLAANSPARFYSALNPAFMGIHRLALFPRDIFAVNSAEDPLNGEETELGTKLSNEASNGRLGLPG